MPGNEKGHRKPRPCLLHEGLSCSAFLGCRMRKDITLKGEDVQIRQRAQVSETLQSILPEVGLTTPNTAAVNTWQLEADRIQQLPKEATERVSCKRAGSLWQSGRQPLRVQPWDLVLNPPSHNQPITHTALGHSRLLCRVRPGDQRVLETETRKTEGPLLPWQMHTYTCPLISLSLSFLICRTGE